MKSWHAEAKSAKWKNPNELKEQYEKTSIIGDGRVVFNICGNKYRLLVWVNFEFQCILIKWIGTHDEHDNLKMEGV